MARPIVNGWFSSANAAGAEFIMVPTKKKKDEPEISSTNLKLARYGERASKFVINRNVTRSFISR